MKERETGVKTMNRKIHVVPLRNYLMKTSMNNLHISQKNIGSKYVTVQVVTLSGRMVTFGDCNNTHSTGVWETEHELLCNSKDSSSVC